MIVASRQASTTTALLLYKGLNTLTTIDNQLWAVQFGTASTVSARWVAACLFGIVGRAGDS